MGAPQKSGPSFIAIAPFVAEQFDTSQPCQLITFNGNLYSIQQTIGSGGGNINGMAVYKSTDNGTTWSASLDAAHAPTAAHGAAFFDVANNRLVFGLVTETFPQTPQPIFIKPFNLQTETWGANIAAAGPSALTLVQHIFIRPDGTFFLVYDFGPTNPGGTSRLRGASWNGAAWSASFDLGFNLVALQANGNISVGNTGATMDAGGNIHLAFTNNLRTIVMYQQWTSADALGPSNNFLGIPFPNSVPLIGSVIISGPNILISTVSNTLHNNTLLIGTPVANPVWSNISPAVLLSPTGHIDLAGPLATDGTNLVWMVNFTTPAFIDFYQIAKSTDNGLTWAILPDNLTPPQFYNFAVSPLAPNTDTNFGTSAPYVAILNPTGKAPTVFGTVNINNSTVGIQAGYFMNSEAFGGTGKTVIAKPILFPRRLPWPVGRPTHTEGKHYMK